MKQFFLIHKIIIGVQILFVPERHHWILTSCIEGSVYVYDSLKTTDKEFPRSVENQLLQLYHPTLPQHYQRQDIGLLAECSSVQQQEGSYDCGLFAIAWAYHLLVGDSLNTLTLDQQKLRRHLARCFERKKLSRFPKSRQETPRSEMVWVSVVASCYQCTRPDSWNDMVQCDGCDKWYHLKCMHMKKAPVSDWYCKDCK